MHLFFEDIKKFLLDTLFPISCQNCGSKGELYLCKNCQNPNCQSPEQVCVICKKPSPSGITHPKCYTSHSPEALICSLNYHTPVIKDLLIKGKYYFVKDIYAELGHIVASKLASEFEDLVKNYDMVTFVPLHKRRQTWRGFNQAEILAEKISERLSIPKSTLLKRTKATKTQKDLKREARLENLKGAFTLSPYTGIWQGKFKKIILVDDVVTTGSTLTQATAVLKKNGASAVLCIAVAKD